MKMRCFFDDVILKRKRVRARARECSGRELELLHAIAYHQTAEQEAHEADIWP